MTHLWDKSRTYQEAHHNSYLIPCAKQCSYGITVLAPFQLVLGVHWQLHSKRPGTRWKKCIPQRPIFKRSSFFSKHASSNSQVVSSNSWFVICSKMGFLKLPLLYEQHPLLYEQHPLSSTPTITFFSNIFERFCSKMFEICSNEFEKTFRTSRKPVRTPPLRTRPSLHDPQSAGSLAGSAMASPRPVLRNGWSASTMLAGIHHMDKECLLAIKQELPDDPNQLEKLKQASFR